MSSIHSLDDSIHFFRVAIAEFEGPIDLLLHLVKQRELPIEKVSLASVCEQFVAAIQDLEGLDLELAAEYLLIAAVLTSIKVSVLLNQPVELVADQEGNMIDPHEILLQRLREAAVFKDVARSLEERPLLGIDVFAPKQKLDVEIEREAVEEFEAHDAYLLGRAFRALLKGATDQPGLVISVESVSIVDRMLKVIEQIGQSQGGAKSFRELLPKFYTRTDVIATFLALLELCKRQLIGINQVADSADILITGREMVSDLKLDSEFDLGAEMGKAVGE